MKKQPSFPNGLKLSPASRAFILVAILVITLLVLLWPPATWAFLEVLKALPAILTALAAFLAIRGKSRKSGSDE